MKKFDIFAFIASLLCMCLLNSCSKTLKGGDIIGHYEANHKKGVDSLDLNGNGTYDYMFIDLDGKTLENKGTWILTFDNGVPVITLDNFKFGLKGYGTDAPGFWVVHIEKSFGTVRLPLDPDLGYYYYKRIVQP